MVAPLRELGLTVVQWKRDVWPGTGVVMRTRRSNAASPRSASSAQRVLVTDDVVVAERCPSAAVDRTATASYEGRGFRATSRNHSLSSHSRLDYAIPLQS